MRESSKPDCRHWIGAEHRYCREADGVRLYIPGNRCPAHTPNALKGLPEIPPGPGWPASAWTTPTPDSVASVIDERAIASGRRRSGQQTYRAAQAAQAERQKRRAS